MTENTNTGFMLIALAKMYLLANTYDKGAIQEHEYSTNTTTGLLKNALTKKYLFVKQYDKRAIQEHEYIIP